MRRAAYSLIEVTMAMALFSMMISLTFESLASYRMYFQSDQSRFILDLEARRAMKIVLDDLSNSAWHIPGTMTDKTQLLDPSLDRELRYYPYLQVASRGDPVGWGGGFTPWRRADSEIVDLSVPFYSGKTLPARHTQPSQELVFLKVARYDHVDNPNNMKKESVDLGKPGIPFGDYWKAPQVDSMILQFEGTTVSDAKLSFQMNTSGDIREYSYVVVPYKGKRELRRRYAHRNNTTGVYTSAVQSDGEIISRYVDRIVVDTVRTMPGLSADQVRVTLYLSRLTNKGVLQLKELSITVAMRSTVDPELAEGIDNWLGVAGEFPVIPIQ